MSKIEEHLEIIQTTNFMSTFDLTNGSFHILIPVVDITKKAFIVPSGVYAFKHMPFGHSGAPSHILETHGNCPCSSPKFFLTHLLGPYYYVCYIWRECMSFKIIFQLFYQAELTVKMEKCQCSKQKIKLDVTSCGASVKLGWHTLHCLIIAVNKTYEILKAVLIQAHVLALPEYSTVFKDDGLELLWYCAMLA